jgi:hypothetical protein
MDKIVHLLAGTRKGLFLFTSTPDRTKWSSSGPFLSGREVNHATVDPRSGRIFATSNDSWFGCEIAWSDSLGEEWTMAEKSPGFAADSGSKLERIWHIEAGPTSAHGVLYAGVAPAALFRSEDNGANWEQVNGLSQHPTRQRWQPGAGGLCLHSIVPDPTNPEKMWVGISAVGVFLTEDGGATWSTRNQGTRAGFMPDPLPEWGQCVHKLLRAPGTEDRLYQQNHCGVYASDNGGTSWTEVTEGLPSEFGFPLGVHPRDPQTLYTLPLKGSEFRCAPDARLRVFRSRDAGGHWEALADGLPQEGVYCSVLREGMAVDTADPAGIYFGTNTGKIFGSADEGDSWYLLADNLPPVYSVEVW